MKEWKRWLKQAEKDLKAAKDILSSGHYEWACFLAQQSAEKALKALLYKLGYKALITHGIRDLIQEAKKHYSSFGEFEEEAIFLDSVYLPSRYPNSLNSDKPPGEYYTLEDAEKCIEIAEKILAFVRKNLENEGR